MRKDEEAPRLRGVVGIGASAGGLEACSELLKKIPDDFDLPILLVQHLARDQESHFFELLDTVSTLPVREAKDGLEVEPTRVYVIPPNKQMELQDGRLKLSRPSLHRTRLDTIDVLFSSIAREAGNRAIGVVLSGTASDGAAGVRDIHAAGGLTVVQDPETAAQPGMPRAAIATGIVDLVLPAAQIGRELARLLDHPFLADAGRDDKDRSELHEEREVKQEIAVPDDPLKHVLEFVREDCGIDFREYKASTLRRRLKRRMALRRVEKLEDYLTLLQQDRNEVKTLSEDILINVTSFFREPRSFEVLTSTVFPALTQDRKGDAPIRIWVPGCSSGEEAYSVAIQLIDSLGEKSSNAPIQIFATDISEPSIQRARTGWFPETIANDVPEDYLRRFFKNVDGGYQVHKSIRDLCVVSRQDLIRDPPFSRIDLIVCRNVLIYMTEPLQRRLAKVFHYALVPNGFLMLGTAETLALDHATFDLADKEARLYRKKPGTHASFRDLPSESRRTAQDETLSPRSQRRLGRSIEQEARRLTLLRYAPPSVLVDPNFQIVDTQGHTAPYLELAPGEPSFNVLKMAREGLSRDLRKALTDAREGNAPVRRTGIRVRQNGTSQTVNLEVVPIRAEDDHPHFLVYFENPEPRREPAPAPASEPTAPPERERERSEQELERALEENRDYLQSIINDLEAANEELQSANEEILSSNEELQSTNEELDTAKEELQSTNEELNTINEELASRNEELTRVNSDLMNLFANVHMALVIVSRDQLIRRITPLAQELLNIIPADVGRPIGQIKPNIDCPDLEALIQRCIDNVDSAERQVRDHDGRWYSLRIRPYKDLEDRIDGAVMTLVDIDELRRQEAEVEKARQFSEAIVDSVKEPLLVLTHDLCVELVNPAFVSLFGISSENAKGKPFYELGQREWDVSGLRAELEDVISKRKPMDRFQVQASFRGLGTRKFWVHARRIEAGDGRPELILATLEDLSETDSKELTKGNGS